MVVDSGSKLAMTVQSAVRTSVVNVSPSRIPPQVPPTDAITYPGSGVSVNVVVSPEINVCSPRGEMVPAGLPTEEVTVTPSPLRKAIPAMPTTSVTPTKVATPVTGSTWARDRSPGKVGNVDSVFSSAQSVSSTGSVARPVAPLMV